MKTDQKSLFISRELSPASVFQFLKKKGWRLIDRSLVLIEPLDFGGEPDCDWLFFYSKNGIRCYFNQRSFSVDKKYGVMAEGSARVFRQITGHEANFVGQGRPKDIAERLDAQLQSQSVLFVKAVHSKESIYQLLGDGVEKHNVDVYRNGISESVPEDEFDYLVFTSPMNAKAFFNKRSYKGETVLSIGATTAGFLKNYYGIDAIYPATPSERALFELLKSKAGISS